MSKKSHYVCSNCGAEPPKWEGRCSSCGEWDSIIEKKLDERPVWSDTEAAEVKPLNRWKISSKDRISSKFEEIDRVLGGGFVEGQVVLLSGEPGVGKSTILLQLLGNLVGKQRKALYISGEESGYQVALRAKRLLSQRARKSENLGLIAETDVDRVMATVGEFKPDFVIVDSIQTMQSSHIGGFMGGVAQVRAAASKLLELSKKLGITTVIVGHINKEGNIAGPQALEHIVDTVLYLEGDRKSGYRILRSLKNRFGSVQEVGIFEMGEAGMKEVKNPSGIFVSKDRNAVGACLGVVIEGSRPLIVEVQALTVKTPFSLPRRIANGISNSRLQMLIAVLSKHCKINLYDKDVYVNLVGGLTLKDPDLDLPICLAIASSVKEKPIKNKLVACGEATLTGNLRRVTRAEEKEKETKRQGYCLIPSRRSFRKSLRQIIGEALK